MNKSEFESLKNKHHVDLSWDVLRVKKNHTLIWGYTLDRASFHVYLYEGEFHKKVYGGYNKVDEYVNFGKVVNYNEFCRLIPSKRIYPEACDFDFCWFLRDSGENLSFTTFNEDRKVQDFYGDVHFKEEE